MADSAEISESTLGQQPEPNPDAIEAEAANRQKRFEGLTDRMRRAFDPELHDTDANGDPVLTSKGNLRIRRRTVRTTQLPSGGSDSTGPRSGPQEDPVSALDLALVTVDTIFGITTGLPEKWGFGAHWAPRIEKDAKTGDVVADERANMVIAFERYYRKRGVTDLPPELFLALSLGAYVGSRTAEEQTRAAWKGGFTGWWARRKARNAHPDSGADGERENDPGSTPSA